MTKSLTKRKFNELINLAEAKATSIISSRGFLLEKRESNFDCWRRYMEMGAYEAYLKSECKSKEDVFRIAGLAYSWMPTMLELYNDEILDWDSLLKEIKQFKKNNLDVRQELVTKLSRLINHSIVGASKTLHLINHEFAPLVDSRVARGWNVFFKSEIGDGEICPMPQSWNWTKGNEKEHSKKVNSYILYWDYLLEWKGKMNEKITLRDIEVIFFLIGQPTQRNEN